MYIRFNFSFKISDINSISYIFYAFKFSTTMFLLKKLEKKATKSVGWLCNSKRKILLKNAGSNLFNCSEELNCQIISKTKWNDTFCWDSNVTYYEVNLFLSHQFLQDSLDEHAENFLKRFKQQTFPDKCYSV